MHLCTGLIQGFGTRCAHSVDSLHRMSKLTSFMSSPFHVPAWRTIWTAFCSCPSIGEPNSEHPWAKLSMLYRKNFWSHNWKTLYSTQSSCCLRCASCLHYARCAVGNRNDLLELLMCNCIQESSHSAPDFAGIQPGCDRTTRSSDRAYSPSMPTVPGLVGIGLLNRLLLVPEQCNNTRTASTTCSLCTRDALRLRLLILLC